MEFDRRVKRTDREGEGVLVGSAFTHIGRFWVEFEDYGLFTSKCEIESASPEARAWIDGYVAGSVPQPPENPEALQRWREEKSKFEADGRHWRYRLPRSWKVDQLVLPEVEPVLNVNDLGPAAIEFLEVGAANLGSRTLADFLTPLDALAYEVSVNETAAGIWREVFSRSDARPVGEHRAHDNPLMIEWAAWAALQDFFNEYPKWEPIDRVVRDIQSFSKPAVPNPQNAWWETVLCYTLPESNE